MKVSVNTYGGQVATMNRRPLVLDSSDLGVEGQQELRRLVAAASRAYERAPTPGGPDSTRDAMSYSITVDDGGTSQVLEATDGSVSAEFAELRRFVRTHQQS